MTQQATYKPVAGSKINLYYQIVYKDGAFALMAYNPMKMSEKMIFALPDEVFKLMQKCYKKEKRLTCRNSNESAKS